jgi:hypothetical protein
MTELHPPPHPEKLAQGPSRNMLQGTRCGPPFETPAARAPQGEGLILSNARYSTMSRSNPLPHPEERPKGASRRMLQKARS